MTGAPPLHPSDPPPDSGLTPEDVLLAKEAWRKAAGAVYRGLLDATPVNGQ